MPRPRRRLCLLSAPCRAWARGPAPRPSKPYLRSRLAANRARRASRSLRWASACLLAASARSSRVRSGASASRARSSSVGTRMRTTLLKGTVTRSLIAPSTPTSISRAFAGTAPCPGSAPEATSCPICRAIVLFAQRLGLLDRACAWPDAPTAGVLPCDPRLPVGSQFAWPSPPPSCPSERCARTERGETRADGSDTNRTPRGHSAASAMGSPYSAASPPAEGLLGAGARWLDDVGQERAIGSQPRRRDEFGAHHRSTCSERVRQRSGRSSDADHPQ